MKSRQVTLRIAMATSSLVRAGAEKQFVYMARALHEAGVDVRVFYFGTGGFYENVLRSVGIPIFELSYGERPLLTLLAMIRAQLGFRPHIVMAGQFGDIIFAGLPGRLCGAMTIAGVRCDGYWEMARYRRRIWLMRRLPHALIANSYQAGQNLASLGSNPQDVEILTNVIDLQDFDHQSSQPVSIPIEPARIVVAAIGRLSPQKRFDRVLDALALIRNAAPLAIGLIVGRDQGSKVPLQERARALGLGPDHLVFMGESDNVPALMKRSHILLHPSDYEGFPNTILEAMAARLPVITTPAGDAPRLVENGRTGYVVDFDDIKGMGERILQLAGSGELRNRLGEAGRRRVEEHHTFPRLSNRLFRILDTLAAHQQRRGLLTILKQFRGVEEMSPAHHELSGNAI